MIARRLERSAGVTLIELTIVIVLTAILSVIALQFGNPIKAYVDTSRRAELADAADTALRRMGRDVRLALPNSARVDATGKYLEFVQVRTGGRYRADVDPAAPGATCTGGAAEDVLSFSVVDNCFRTIGTVANIGSVVEGDYVVIFNLSPGSPNADFYQLGAASNKAKITNAVGLPAATTGGHLIKFEDFQFTFESPGRRFFIVEGRVTYACEGGTLRRYWGYTTATANQPTTTPADFIGGSSAILVQGVSTLQIHLQQQRHLAGGRAGDPGTPVDGPDFRRRQRERWPLPCRPRQQRPMINTSRGRRQSGFLMVALIFLLVVIAGLGLYLTTVSTTSQASSAADLSAAKAYQAARAGAEWAAYWITPSPPAKASAFKTACDGALTATGTLTLGAYTVTVTCTSAAPYTEGTSTVQWYSIVSTACNTPCSVGTSTYVSREVSLTIAN